MGRELGAGYDNHFWVGPFAHLTSGEMIPFLQTFMQEPYIASLRLG